MEENSGSRSMLQTAADLAQAARAAVHIAEAAVAAGPYGAAAAAAQEAFPILLKLAAVLLAVIIFIPLLVFLALPNMFFGYEGAQTGEVARMTRQAMGVGSAYMDLEDFEKKQMDAIVSSVVEQFKSEGQAVDKVEVSGGFSEDGLRWLIAVNSVRHRQDLGEMTAEDIRSFCASRLACDTSAIPGGSELKLTFKDVDPDALMEALDFTAEEKIWAKTIYMTLSKSGALDKYAGYFGSSGTGGDGYGGGTAYPVEAQRGDGAGLEIDTSRFISPGTKNNRDLVAYAVQAWENGWGYVWGTYGNVLTPSLLDYKAKQYPDGVGDYLAFIRSHWLGGRTTDCVGLIKGYGWLDAAEGKIRYGTNGMPDYGANGMYQAAKRAGAEGRDYGPMSAMPDIPGLAVWKKGHIGIYIGGGYVIEAMGTSKGVVKTAVKGRGWSGWCRIPYIEYWE